MELVEDELGGYGKEECGFIREYDSLSEAARDPVSGVPNVHGCYGNQAGGATERRRNRRSGLLSQGDRRK